jgi:hypothetical protein
MKGLTFGHKIDGINYVDRPGAYAVMEDMANA